jgi:hypothetical protein
LDLAAFLGRFWRRQVGPVPARTMESVVLERRTRSKQPLNNRQPMRDIHHGHSGEYLAMP